MSELRKAERAFLKARGTVAITVAKKVYDAVWESRLKVLTQKWRKEKE